MPAAPGEYRTVVNTFRYDFAAQGGAIGAITLDGNGNGGNGKLPDNAVITRAWSEVITPLTSGGLATVALGVTGAPAALLAATNFSDASFASTDAVANRNAATPTKVNNAAGVSVLATVATAALTGGKVDIHVEYLQGA